MGETHKTEGACWLLSVFALIDPEATGVRLQFLTGFGGESRSHSGWIFFRMLSAAFTLLLPLVEPMKTKCNEGHLGEEKNVVSAPLL